MGSRHIPHNNTIMGPRHAATLQGGDKLRANDAANGVQNVAVS